MSHHDINRRRNLRLKAEVLGKYSPGGVPSCACCGEGHLHFLTLGHGGSTRKRTTGRRLLAWAKRVGYPRGLLVLCWNCYQGRQANAGVCPHHSPAIEDVTVKEYTGMEICGRGVILSDVAKRTRISVTHLSNIFSGRRKPSMDAIIKIASDTGLAIDDLVVYLNQIRREPCKRKL